MNDEKTEHEARCRETRLLLEREEVIIRDDLTVSGLEHNTQFHSFCKMCDQLGRRMTLAFCNAVFLQGIVGNKLPPLHCLLGNYISIPVELVKLHTDYDLRALQAVAWTTNLPALMLLSKELDQLSDLHNTLVLLVERMKGEDGE